MELFCTDGEWIRYRAREKRYTRIFRVLACFTPALFVILCLFVRTANAKTMHIVLLAVTGTLGGAAVTVRMLLVRPARRELKHLEMIRTGEKTELEGRLTVTGESFRIPKSVRVRRIILDTGAERPVLLNVDERWTGRMPPDGAYTRLAVVHSYIAGAETAVPPAQHVSGRNPPGIRRFFRALSEVAPLLILWAFFTLIFGSFVFYQITDTVPARKITLFVDGATLDEDLLASRLEAEMPDPVRMVKVHPFSYMMFGDEELKTADLYIVPDSRADLYRAWFSPGENSLLVFDPQSGLSVAGEYILYIPEGTEGEPYRLYIGGNSCHLEDGMAKKAAELFLGMETEKEEIR